VGHEGTTILLVDDDDAGRLVLSCVLEDEGYSVTAVPSIKEALLELDRAQFDLALLDYNLHGEKGLDLVPALRALPRRPLIVMLSGQDRIDGSQVDACITKGVPSGELLSKLEEAQRGKGNS
jgi:CheY-like chemotaxis protein